MPKDLPNLASDLPMVDEKSATPRSISTVSLPENIFYETVLPDDSIISEITKSDFSNSSENIRRLTEDVTIRYVFNLFF